MSSFALTPEELITLALPILHYSMSQYEISRKKYVSIALASICHVLQEVHNQIRDDHLDSSYMSTCSETSGKVNRMLLFRDRFLKHLFARFPNTFDLEEIWGIVQDLTEQTIKVNTQYMELSNSNSESSGELYDDRGYGSEECNDQSEQFHPLKSNKAIVTLLLSSHL